MKIILALLIVLTAVNLEAAKCCGQTPCKACKNCKHCAHCNPMRSPKDNRPKPRCGCCWFPIS